MCTQLQRDVVRACIAPLHGVWEACRTLAHQVIYQSDAAALDDAPVCSGLIRALLCFTEARKQVGICPDIRRSESVSICGPCRQVRVILKQGRHKDLVAADELGIMIRNRRAFEGWNEGPLSFPPTFKFKRGTGHYLGDCPCGQSAQCFACPIGFPHVSLPGFSMGFRCIRQALANQ